MNPDTNDTIGLSRRKLLAGLGAVGVASAGAGLGTTAYFNDTESFTNNTLTAGELDLKLDYRATYAGGTGRIDEINGWYSESGPGEPFEVVEEEDGVYLIGEVPSIDEADSWEDEVQTRDFCAPDVGLINGDQIPVFVLDDVKPGDCGEVTISLHICDNPSWVWMNGELTANDENTVSEPEAGADGEGNALGDDSNGPITGEGELADAIDVTMWYDENCNNVYEAGGESGGPLCVQIVLDASGSMGGNRNTQAINGAKTLAESILQDGPAGSRVGVTFFSASGYDESAQVIQTLTDDLDDVLDAIDTLPANGSNTAIGEGIEAAQGNLENCDDDESPTMVVLTDGGNNAGTDPGDAADDAKDAGTEIYALGVGGAQVSTLNEISSDPDEEYVFFASDDGALEQAFGLISETLLGESIIFEGSLADAMAELEAGIALDGNRSVEGRQPYEGGLTQCIGFEWCLPAEVGNEVQTDSVVFDLGFYAEQFRHNDDPQVTFNGTQANSTSTGNVSQ